MKLLSSAQSSILFLLGLSLAAGFAVAGDEWHLYVIRGARTTTTENPIYISHAPVALDLDDRAAAATAWAYFQSNTRPETGLVDSIAGYPSTTLWDQASYFLALTAGNRLNLIDHTEFEARAEKGLHSLKELSLVEGLLPNKVYNTQTLEMVDYANQPAPGGIGWSALDISRLLLSLRILEDALPSIKPMVRDVVSHWELNALTSDGEIIGAKRDGGNLERVQEGRIGYEQYAARALLLWGVDASVAVRADRISAWQAVQDVQIAIDRRRPDAFGAIAPVLSEPYILHGLELGFDQEAAVLAARVYAAQEARYLATGIQTMVSEDHLNQAPFFLFSSVYNNNSLWSVVSDTGEQFPHLRTISTKAVFAWDALYRRPYTRTLRDMLKSKTVSPAQGWPAGVYESDKSLNDILSLNTNAVVLEAIFFKAFGPMLRI